MSYVLVFIGYCVGIYLNIRFNFFRTWLMQHTHTRKRNLKTMQAYNLCLLIFAVI